VNVACYYLQHPSSAPVDSADVHWAFVEAYRSGGPAAVNQLERRRVARNRPARLDSDEAPRAPDRTRRPHYTIEDLSVDGSFPAEGYEQRMNEWVASVLSERAAE
jgi:hypothetical protein